MDSQSDSQADSYVSSSFYDVFGQFRYFLAVKIPWGTLGAARDALHSEGKSLNLQVELQPRPGYFNILLIFQRLRELR